MDTWNKHCLRCGHDWVRRAGRDPKVCPRCKRRDWESLAEDINLPPWRYGKEEITDARTYRSWIKMRQRCFNPKNERYADYGGRGIGVSERWNYFLNFLEDMGARPAGMSLDRIDNNASYGPSNCRWATPLEQARNRRKARAR